MSSLFGRLMAQPLERRVMTRQENASAKIARLKHHLETLLNTRQGCSQSSPELGLRDFNGYDLSGGDLLQQITADIRHTVQRYEPRIAIRALKAVPAEHTPLELHFQLDCLVQVNNRAEQLQLELLVNGLSRLTRVR